MAALYLMTSLSYKMALKIYTFPIFTSMTMHIRNISPFFILLNIGDHDNKEKDVEIFVPPTEIFILYLEGIDLYTWDLM